MINFLKKRDPLSVASREWPVIKGTDLVRVRLKKEEEASKVSLGERLKKSFFGRSPESKE